MGKSVLVSLILLVMLGPSWPQSVEQDPCALVSGEAAALRCHAEEQRLQVQETAHGLNVEELQERMRAEIAESRQQDDARRAEDIARNDAVMAAIEADRAAREAARLLKEAADQEALKAWQANVSLQREEAAKADAEDPFKWVDILDLEIAPERFVGRKLKVGGMQCYAVGQDDFRCMSGTSHAVVFTPAVEPASASHALEDSCGTVRAAMDHGCRRTLRFVLDAFAVDKTINGEGRVVLKPRLITVSW